MLKRKSDPKTHRRQKVVDKNDWQNVYLPGKTEFFSFQLSTNFALRKSAVYFSHPFINPLALKANR